MIDLLIYLLDNQYEDEIISTLKGRNFLFHKATSVEELVEICKQEFVDLILVWPATHDVVADVLTVLNMQELAYLPVIPVVHKNEDFSAVLQLPIADIITIPLPREEFFIHLNKLSHAIDDESNAMQGQHWQGNLDEFSLIDLIQMVETSHKDAILSISYRDHLGQVYFRGGKVIRASFRNLDTFHALSKLVNLSKANFHVQFTRVDLADSLELSNEELLVELVQQLGEQEKYFQSLPNLQEEYISVESLEPPQNEVQAQILDLCQEGETLSDLMISMNEDNQEILKNALSLVEGKMLVRRQDFELLEKQKAEKKGLGRLFNSFGSFFKKEKKTEEIEEPTLPPPVKMDIAKPELIHQPAKINPGAIQSISKYLREQ